MATIEEATANVLDDSGHLVDEPAVEAEVDEGVASTDETSDASTETPADEGASTEETPEVVEEAAPVALDLSGIDRDSLTPEMQVQYDRMVQQGKLMNAGFTQKMQKLGLEGEAKSALELEVADLRSRLETLQAPPAIAEQVQADGEPDYYEGLGEPITPAMVKASDDPDLFFRYTQQVAEVAARKAQYAFAMQVLPEIQAVRDQSEQQRTYEAAQSLSTFFSANADLEPFRAEMASAMQAGFAHTLEEAGEVVRARHFAPQREADAYRLGEAQAEARHQAASKNKDSFSVPASSTAPGSGNPYAGKTIDQIGEMLVAELG